MFNYTFTFSMELKNGILHHKNIEIFQLAENEANVECSRNVTKNSQDITENKCNQCKYKSSNAGHLRIHLKRHSGEKPNKCNQCDYASFDASNFRRHLETHGGEK